MGKYKNLNDVEYLEEQTGDRPKYAIIFLHGLGGDAAVFAGVSDKLNLPEAARCIIPNGTLREITSYPGQPMRGWYDARGEAFGEDTDRAGLNETTARIQVLIDQENRRGIPDERIFLAGFSQGGAAMYYSGLRHANPLAGLIAFSTYMPFVAATETERSDATSQTPILVTHGSEDKVIGLDIGERTRDWLIAHGYDVQWGEYSIEHVVGDVVFPQVSQFIAGQMTNQ